MRSTKDEKTTFSMADFEKGLMLAGYLMPRSVAELNEREELEKYEEELKGKKKNVYFKRVVLAAEIAHQLHNEPSLGRVKFQKLVYLCEHAAEMNVEHRYKKMAAGPFDNKFMHSIDKELASNKWFFVHKLSENNRTRYKYEPLENAEGFKKYYESFFKNEKDNIQYIIDLFRTQRTEDTELAATVFACIKELTAKNLLSKDELLKLFYNWSKEKSKFSETRVIQSCKWLHEKGLIECPEQLWITS